MTAFQTALGISSLSSLSCLLSISLVESDCLRRNCSVLSWSGSLWGYSGATGLFVEPYLDGLQWIGCVGNGCAPSAFYCTDTSATEMTFGSTSGELRALLGSGALPTSFTSCATSSIPRDIMNAPDKAEDAVRLCMALGYATGTVVSVVSNTCPEPHFNGTHWTSDFVQSTGYGQSVTCSGACTDEPSFPPTVHPSSNPSMDPSSNPSMEPTFSPSIEPTHNPSIEPTSSAPTGAPTQEPTVRPTVWPTGSGNAAPTESLSVDGHDGTVDHDTTSTSSAAVDAQGAIGGAQGEDAQNGLEVLSHLDWLALDNLILYGVVLTLSCALVACCWMRIRNDAQIAATKDSAMMAATNGRAAATALGHLGVAVGDRYVEVATPQSLSGMSGLEMMAIAIPPGYSKREGAMPTGHGRAQLVVPPVMGKGNGRRTGGGIHDHHHGTAASMEMDMAQMMEDEDDRAHADGLYDGNDDIELPMTPEGAAMEAVPQKVDVPSLPPLPPNVELHSDSTRSFSRGNHMFE